MFNRSALAPRFVAQTVSIGSHRTTQFHTSLIVARFHAKPPVAQRSRSFTTSDNDRLDVRIGDATDEKS